jgi:hypothetical protein
MLTLVHHLVYLVNLLLMSKCSLVQSQLVSWVICLEDQLFQLLILLNKLLDIIINHMVIILLVNNHFSCKLKQELLLLALYTLLFQWESP